MSDVVHTDIVMRLKQAAEAKIAANPALIPALLAGGAGLLGGGALAAKLTHDRDLAARERARNTAFGAGAAAGFAGPQLIDALHAAVHQGGQ
jgi:hypothetical protein